MSVHDYSIWIDRAAYCGESDAAEAAPAAGGQWWLQRPIMTRNALAIGGDAPLVIAGSINLRSHMERILSRHRDGTLSFEEITIRCEPAQ